MNTIRVEYNYSYENIPSQIHSFFIDAINQAENENENENLLLRPFQVLMRQFDLGMDPVIAFDQYINHPSTTNSVTSVIFAQARQIMINEQNQWEQNQ